VAALDAPGDVLGHQRRLEPVSQGLDAGEVGRVRRVGRAEREADAVEGERVALADELQLAQAQAARGHVVLGVDLDPGEARGRALDELLEVRVAEPDPGQRAQRRGVGHGPGSFPSVGPVRPSCSGSCR
jgi:hypothetical protein